MVLVLMRKQSTGKTSVKKAALSTPVKGVLPKKNAKLETPHPRRERQNTVQALVHDFRIQGLDFPSYWIGGKVYWDRVQYLRDHEAALKSAKLELPGEKQKYLAIISPKHHVLWRLTGLSKSGVYSRKHVDTESKTTVRGSIPQLREAYGSENVHLVGVDGALKLCRTYNIPTEMHPKQ